MGLQESWKRVALNQQGKPVKHVWDDFYAKEKAVYKTILRDKVNHIEGTVSELAEKFSFSEMQMYPFLDGINEAVDGLTANVEEIEADTPISFDVDFAKLYKKMVEYKAEELYNLPEWNEIFTPEEQKQLYTEEKRSHTTVRTEAKIGRNETCPCGSGKKYKKCCGA